MLFFRFLPSAIAAVTDVVAGFIVVNHQPDYPLRFLIFQVAMLGLALRLAAPYHLLWMTAFVLLIVGVFLTGFTVAFLYIPTVVEAGLVMTWRWAHVHTGSTDYYSSYSHRQ
jgi:hypothetical protein